MLIEVDQIVEAAKGIVNVTPSAKLNRTFERRWNSAFGALPGVCCILWNKIDPMRTMPKGVQPKHLLWGLLLLTVYETEENSAQRAGNVDEKTFRKWSHLFVEAMSFLEFDVVSSYSAPSGS